MTALLLMLALAGAPEEDPMQPGWEVVPYVPNLPYRVRPPCPTAFAFDGYCWAETLFKLPCPPGTVQHDMFCYMPIIKPPQDKRPKQRGTREPTS